MNINETGQPRQLVKDIDVKLFQGDRVTVKVGARQENGLYSVTIKGQTLMAKLPQNMAAGLYRAEVAELEPLELKMMKSAEESANPTSLKQGSVDDKYILSLSKGSIGAKIGEQLNISILKSLGGGMSLASIKDNLFKINLGDILFKSIEATVTGVDPDIELQLSIPQTSSLDSGFVKSLLAGFDISKILQSMRGANTLAMEQMDAEALKNAIRKSGLFLESALLNGEDVSDDEKMRAMQQGDSGRGDSLTRMQVVNLLIGNGMIGYLKTKDETVDDALYRIKKDESGGFIFHLTMEFSNIGKTYIRMRPVQNIVTILVKTEKDISEELAELEIADAYITWSPFGETDMEVFNFKHDIGDSLSNLDLRA